MLDDLDFIAVYTESCDLQCQNGRGSIANIFNVFFYRFTVFFCSLPV